MSTDDPFLELALLRYRILAEAIEAPPDARQALLRALAEKEHRLGQSEPEKVSLRTLQRWARGYERHGIRGLLRKARRDRGELRGLTQPVIERVIRLRKEEPSRSTPKLIDILEREGTIAKDAVKRSTLDRHLEKQGSSRRLMHSLGVKRHVRLYFELPLQFVVGDFHHGPYVRTETGEIRRSKLEAFIDHASRYVPESRYGMNEDVMSLRRALRALGTLWGLPDLLYVDNGSAFQAGRFHFGCDQLGIKLVHSTAYVSEGRGVIERFNRTVKEAFETEVRLRPEPPTLEELNAFWRAWLEERYHRVKHSETGEEPLARWNRLIAAHPLRKGDPVLLDEVLRLQKKRTVHSKTCTVEVCGVPFVVDSGLKKRRVQVLYDPHDLSSVLIFFDGRRIQRATPQIPGEHPVTAQAPEAREASTATVDYLALLRRDHERRRAEELSTIRFDTAPAAKKRPEPSAPLTIGALHERLLTCTGRSLGEVEKQLAAEALGSLSPLEISIAETALKTAVAFLGHGLHASQYLNALREHVLAARKKGSP